MKYLRYLMSAIITNIRFLFLRICGCRVYSHLTSFISPSTTIRLVGKESKIVFGKELQIRPDVEISATNATIVLGDKCFINRFCMVVAHESIEIGDGTTIGPNTCIYDHDHDMKGNNIVVSKPIIIGKNVWIGASCVLLKGITVGDNAVIAAGSIVTKDIPPNTIFIQKKKEEYISRYE